jgi:hypothetical protein
MPGEDHVTKSSEVTNMAIRLLSFRKRAFLNSAATLSTSYIQAVIDSSRNGENRWGTNLLTIADCRRKIELEFFLQ